MAQLMSIKRNVEMCPGQVSVPAIYHVSQGDKGTRIILGLVNNSANYTIPEGTTATIRGHRADGTLFTEITADVETTEVKFNLTENMSAVPGRAECEAVLASGSANIIGTANFIIDVEKSPASIGSVFPGTDAAETWLIDELTNLDISALDDESVVDAINSKMGGTFETTDAGKVLMVNQDGTVSPAAVDLSGKANESTIAPEFDSSASYTAGQYVYKNGVLYKFTSTHSGAWTGSDAEVVTVVGEVEGVKNLTIPALYGNVGSDFPIQFENGTYQYTSTGSTLVKYYGGGYDLTRKVVKSTTFDAPCDVLITAKTGYSFTVFTSVNGVITGNTGLVTSYTLVNGNQYGIILRATDGTSDISGIDASQIVDIMYYLRVDKTLLIENVPADAKATGDKISDVSDTVDELNDLLTEKQSVNPEISSYGTYITGSNKWGNSTSSSPRACGIILIPEGATKIKFKSHLENYSQVAILTSSTHTNNTTPSYATGWDNIDTVSANTEKIYDVPSDGKYLYYTRFFGTNQRTPQSIIFTKFVEINQIPPLGLHEMPENQNLLNIVKRCRQMTDIEWTPAVDLPRFMLVQRAGEIPDTADSQHYLGTFKAGVKYHGIPYGRVSQTMDDYGYEYGTVGRYVDFKAFVTSAANKDSMLCKRDVSSIANHGSVAYATVCSGMTCYALDVPEVATANIANISGLSLVGKLNNNGVLLDDSLVKIGYVLNLAGEHTAIITDIIRDTDGVIQFVELSDASSAGLADRNYSDGEIGGVCRRKGWARSAFYQAGSWGDYSVYRYNGDVPYTPSLYVNVGDEFDCQRIEHFPCMPYEGEGFIYKTGYIPNNSIKILISLSGYGYLKVFKDETEITGSPFAITSETTSVDISVLDEGSYTAYLCNITDGNVVNLTYPCHWTIET